MKNTVKLISQNTVLLLCKLKFFFCGKIQFAGFAKYSFAFFAKYSFRFAKYSFPGSEVLKFQNAVLSKVVGSSTASTAMA